MTGMTFHKPTPALRATPKAKPMAKPDGSTSPSGEGHTNGDRSPVRVLIVEDNDKLASSLQKGLGENGFNADIALTGAAAEQLATNNTYDLIVLDLMLPDRDGVSICRDLRAAGNGAAILMLSALSATKDKVSGLDAGADDYLAKPFEFEELLSRLRALMRRGQNAESSILRYGDIELDVTKRVARRGGQTIPLTNKEFGLLDFFMRRPGQVLTRTQIGEHVWDMNFDPSSNVIDVYVSMLRRKIDRGFPVPLIHTVVGTGYQFGDKPSPV